MRVGDFRLVSPSDESLAKTRHEWIEASEFHELSDREVLDRVLVAARTATAPALVLLDLDSTLYEVAPRTLQILREWSATADASQFATVKQALASLNTSHVGYSLKDTLSAVGLNLASAEAKAAFQLARPFWKDRFF